MKTLILCPVCGYDGIEGEFCPNCDTDISLIRALKELQPATISATLSPPDQFKPISQWKIYQVLGLIFLFILAGFGAGFYSQRDKVSPTPIVLTFPVIALPTPPTKRIYTVSKGDTLAKIARQFCGQKATWHSIVHANPHLSGRVNALHIGENIIIPDC